MQRVHSKIIAFLIITFFVFTTCWGELSQRNVGQPHNAWEHLSPDIDAALDLTTRTEKGTVKNVLKLYVKNVSQTTKQYSVFGQDDGVQILYLNGDSVTTPLHKADLQLIDRTFQLELKPGAKICITLPISTEEMTLLTSHPVKFVFVIVDPATKKFSKLESTPTTLTQVSP
jgi:hypothetical protein